MEMLQKNLSKPTPFETDKFVQFRQVFGLHRFNLRRHLIDRTLKSVWFRQVLGLRRVWFSQVLGLRRGWFRQVLGLHCVWFRQVLGLRRVWFRQVLGLRRVWFRQVSLYKFCSFISIDIEVSMP